MGLNIEQIYIANPSTTLPGTALLYVGLAPFSITNDSAISYVDLETQLMATSATYFLPLAGGALTGAVTTTSTLQFKTIQVTAGTISQSGFNLTGSGTAFTSAMNGGVLVPSSGSTQTVLNVNSGTSAIMSLSQTIAAGTTYILSYYSNPNYLDQDQSAISTVFSNAGFSVWGNSTTHFLNNGIWATRKGFYADNNAQVSPYFPGVTVSQSGTAITGVGTSFPANYKGRLMIFSTGQTAFITAVNSTTSLTAATSQTVPSTSFFVAGQVSAAATCMDGFGNFGANNLYVYSTLNLPNGTLSVAANTNFAGAFGTTITSTATTNATLPAGTTTLVPTTGTGATGTWGINISGSAATATTVTTNANLTGDVTSTGNATTYNGIVPLAKGGTNKALTAANGAIPYIDADSFELLAPTATARQMFQSGASGAPTWSTTTYPATNAINTIPYASAANVMGVIATANDGVLITSAGGVPSISSTLPAAVQNTITAVSSGASTLTIGGFLKTFTGAAANVAASGNVAAWPSAPGLSFGGLSTGITYSFQSGYYSITTMPNGQIKTECWVALGLSNKGSATGNAMITNFPTVAGAAGSSYIFACAQENITAVAGGAIFANMTASSSTATLSSYGNGVGNTMLTNTHFANNSVVKFYAVYWNN